MDKVLLKKYANLLLKGVRAMDKKYLFISMPNTISYFKDILLEEASSFDLKDIYVDETDPFKKHEYLTTMDYANLIKLPIFDKSIYNKYAKLDAAFLFIRSDIPGLMDDVDSELLKKMSLYILSTQKYFRDLYESNKLNWCIACVPNEYWAKNGLNITEEELWDKILRICLVDKTSDPYLNWLDKNIILKRYMDTLNSYHFKKLHYMNGLGTDFTIELNDTGKWISGGGDIGLFNNLPTEEVFTSPKYDSCNGIVYASKPLIYNGKLIDNFWFQFENVKVINYNAKKGLDVLKTIVETDDNSCYLGEIALVNDNSPISNTKMLFKETLYDENAACHMALGIGFAECIDTNEEITADDLLKYGVNRSKTHVDFMIGTSDMRIDGYTEDGEMITIMEDGNLII